MTKNNTQKNIPEGWQVRKLDSMFLVRRGGSPRPIENYITDRADGLNWLKIGDIDVGAKYINKTSSKILKEGISRTTLVKKGDFILSNSMSFGRPYIMNIEACIHDGWLTFQDIKTSILNRDFLYYLLSQSKTQAIFTAISAGSGVQNLKKETVSEVALPIPQISEQSRIVKVLETWDKAIEMLAKKIEHKKEIKKVLVEKLLTGDLRLSGLAVDWITYTLKEITTLLKDGSHGTHKDVDSGVALLSAKDIKGGIVNIPFDARRISMDDFKQIHKSYQLKDGDILLCLVGSIGRVAIVTNYKNNFTLQRSVGILRFKNCFPDFMYQFMQTPYFQNELSKKENKGAQGGVYLGELGKIKIKLPAVDEQVEIAKVLITADDEIAQLQNKLTLLKGQKTYLLNNLITGIIRTPENI